MPKRKSTKPSSSLRSALIFATLAILGYLGVSLATGTGPVASFLGSSPIVADLTPYGDIRDVTVKEKRDQKIERGEAPPLTKSQQKSEDVGIADAIDQKKTADENAGDRIIQAAKDDKENEALNQAAARIEAKRTTSTASKVDCSVKCQTIGSPVCSGSYVFTGAGWDSSTGESTRKPNSGGRECTKCGSGDGGVGEFDGSSQSCGDLISSGAPVIIPSSVDPASIGLPPTDSEGKPLRIVSCAEKRDGGWVLSAFGQLAGSEKNADKICGIGGSWINGDVFSAEMAKICKDKDTSYCKSYNSDSDNSRDGSNALETPEAGKQDECQAGFIGVGTRTYIECVVGKKVIRDCGSGGSWNLTKKACDDTTPAANTTRCGPGYTVSGTSCQATATPVILDNYRSNCRGTYDIQTGLCSDSPTVRLTGDPTYQNSGTSFDENASSGSSVDPVYIKDPEPGTIGQGHSTNDPDGCEHKAILVAIGIYRCTDEDGKMYDNYGSEGNTSTNTSSGKFDIPSSGDTQNAAGKYYNTLSCGGRDDLCVSGYCQKNSFVGIDWLATDRCQDPPSTSK